MAKLKFPKAVVQRARKLVKLKFPVGVVRRTVKLRFPKTIHRYVRRLRRGGARGATPEQIAATKAFISQRAAAFSKSRSI